MCCSTGRRSPGSTTGFRSTGLIAPRATLHKLPQLVPSGKDGPILPGFDIKIDELRIDRLTVAPAVTGNGVARQGRLAGKADIRSGRAMVSLDALVQGSDS